MCQQHLRQRIIQTLSVVGFLLGVAASVGVIYYGSTQLASNESTPSGSIMPGGCSAEAFDTHRPLRYTFGNDTMYLECSWPIKNTIVRFSAAIFAALAGLVLMIVQFLKPHLWATRICLFLLMSAVATIATGVFFDTQRIMGATSFCTAKFPDSGYEEADKSKIHCDEFPYVIGVSISVASAVVWIMTLVLSCANMSWVKEKEKQRRRSIDDLADESRRGLLELTSGAFTGETNEFD